MNAKKILALLLAGILMMGLVACGGKKPAPQPTKGPEVTSDTTPGTDDTAQGTDGGEIDIWAAYDEPVQLTTALRENAGIQWRDGDTYDDNPWYREYKKRFNIEVSNAWVSGKDYVTKLNLSIVDNTLPDVFFCTADQFQQLYEADMIWDLTEIYEQYASDTIKGYMEQESSTFETAKRDGRLYGIPQLSFGNIDQVNQIWIRRDWMKATDHTAPKTMDDVVQIAKTFMQQHDTYGMTESKSLNGFKILAPAWNAYPDIWITKADGSIEYGSVQPEIKDALAEYSKWYAEGIINPNFTSMDLTQMSQDVISGVAGLSPFYQWWGYDPGPSVIGNLGPEAVFDAYPIPSAVGADVLAPVEFSNYGYIVVSKKFDKPEAAMKLLNFYAYISDDAAGVEEPEFINNFFTGAYLVLPYGLRVINPNTDYNQYVKVSEALAQGENADVASLGKDAFKYLNCIDFIENQTPESVGDYCQQGNGEFAAYYIAKNALDNDLIIKDVLWGAPADTLNSMGTTLDDILIEGFTKIIVGQEPVDYFDTLVMEWLAAGGEQATLEMNEKYGN